MFWSRRDWCRIGILFRLKSNLPLDKNFEESKHFCFYILKFTCYCIWNFVVHWHWSLFFQLLMTAWSSQFPKNWCQGSCAALTADRWSGWDIPLELQWSKESIFWYLERHISSELFSLCLEQPFRVYVLQCTIHNQLLATLPCTKIFLLPQRFSSATIP